MNSKLHKWHLAVCASVGFGMISLLIVISTIRYSSSPEFEHLHNKEHVYIFGAAEVGFMLILCLVFAIIARKQFEVEKNKE